MAKYYNLWRKYSASIYFEIDKALFYGTSKTIQLQENEFEIIGERNASGYTFRLEINNGEVINNISGTIVARDLFDILSRDEHQSAWLRNKLIIIKMDKAFMLAIECKSLKKML